MAERRALPNLGVHESKETPTLRQGENPGARRPGFALSRRWNSAPRSARPRPRRRSRAGLFGIAATLAFAVVGQAGTGRNQTTDHHVLLQAAQVVALAGHGGFGQHARGFLEG